METPLSPARASQYLHFGPSPEPGAGERFNLNFIGGAIMAATSAYRVPPVVAALAHDRTPAVTGTTHAVPAWEQDHVGQTAFRCRGAMLSVQNCAPGPRAYCADHVWQITLGETALIFGNAPTAFPREWQWYCGAFTAESVLDGFARGARGGLHPLWVPGNMPPGHAGDLRPGYWQGHPQSPRAFGSGRAACIIYQLRADAPLPWTHLFFPRAAFDEVHTEGRWIFARKGEGYAAIWTSTPGVWTTTGTWAERELKIPAPCSGTLAFVGDRELDDSFEAFVARARQLAPTWDQATATLTATLPGDHEPLVVAHDTGATQAGRPLSTRLARVSTPWGSLPLGELAFTLATPHGSYALDLREIESPAGIA